MNSCFGLLFLLFVLLSFLGVESVMLRWLFLEWVWLLWLLVVVVVVLYLMLIDMVYFCIGYCDKGFRGLLLVCLV